MEQLFRKWESVFHQYLSLSRFLLSLSLSLGFISLWFTCITSLHSLILYLFYCFIQSKTYKNIKNTENLHVKAWHVNANINYSPRMSTMNLLIIYCLCVDYEVFSIASVQPNSNSKRVASYISIGMIKAYTWFPI